MPKYKINIDGKFVTKVVPEEFVSTLLSQYPNAELISETPPAENFQNGDAETDASVTPVNPSRASIITGVQPEDTELPSENISLDLVSNIKGKKYDKETNSYIEGKAYEDLFIQEEEEGAESLRLLYEGTGLEFEETNDVNLISDNPIESLRAFESVKVTIDGVDDFIKLQFDTNDPRAYANNINLIEDFTKKYENFLKAPRANSAVKEKLRSWEANSTEIKEGEAAASENFLENKDLFKFLQMNVAS